MVGWTFRDFVELISTWIGGGVLNGVVKKFAMCKKEKRNSISLLNLEEVNLLPIFFTSNLN